MAVSDLLKMGRLMQLEPFVTRVRAAVLMQAAVTPMGGAASAEKNFAIHMLKNPDFNEVSMLALVAADSTVLSEATFTDDAISDAAVTDAAIKSVVSGKWTVVASKYPVPAA